MGASIMKVSTRSVDIWIDKVCLQLPRQKFNPTAAAKATGLELGLVFGRLLELVKEERLGLKWEVRCTGDYCTNVIATFDTLPDEIDQEMMCERCGTSVVVDPNIIFPVFRINQWYIDEVKQASESKKYLP
jgi:hypothetical protein